MDNRSEWEEKLIKTIDLVFKQIAVSTRNVGASWVMVSPAVFNVLQNLSPIDTDSELKAMAILRMKRKVKNSKRIDRKLYKDLIKSL